jgi:hypothetical protein
MVNSGIMPPDSGLLTIVKPLGKPISLKIGEIVEARVVDVLPEGGVTLNLKGSVLTARAEIQFLKDTSILFKVLGTDRSGGELRLQFIGQAQGEAIPDQNDPAGAKTLKGPLQDFSKVLSKTAGTPDRVLDAVEQLLKALPSDIKALPPDMRLRLQVLIKDYIRSSVDNMSTRLDQLLKLLPHDIPEKEQLMQTLKVFQKEITGSSAKLDHLPLRDALINTGVTLEAKLKALLSAMRAPSAGDISDIRMDLKAQLLHLKKYFSSNRDGSAELVNGLLKDIATFQLLSKVTDSFYTFLPLFWEKMKKGDVSFKKSGKDGIGRSYSCRINLDLDQLGELNIVVLMSGKEFFVYFRADNDDFTSALRSSLDELEKRFSASGLSLKGTLFLDKDILPSDLEKLESSDGKVNIRI